jgi:hypothetical protein
VCAGDRAEMTNEVLERRGMGEDSNNAQEASSAGPRKPSVKKIGKQKVPM